MQWRTTCLLAIAVVALPMPAMGMAATHRGFHPRYRVVGIGTVAFGPSTPSQVNALLAKHGLRIPFQSKNAIGDAIDPADDHDAGPAYILQHGRKRYLPLGDHLQAAAIALNDRGDIVGERHDDDQSYEAMLWHEGKAYSLNDLAPASYNLSLSRALAIDDRGEIVVCDHPMGGANGAVTITCWALLPTTDRHRK